MNRLSLICAFSIVLISGCEHQSSINVPKVTKEAKDIKQTHGIGFMVVVDTSGSMDGGVADKNGRSSKISIARKTAEIIVDKAIDFSEKNPIENVHIGIVAFSSSPTDIVAFSKCPTANDPEVAAIRKKINKLSTNGGTAIGDAVEHAFTSMRQKGLTQNHILVITDGENSSGARPIDVATALMGLPADIRPSVYLVAFDVGSNSFKPLEGQGWKVLSATDASSLNQVIGNVIETEILLEK